MFFIYLHMEYYQRVFPFYPSNFFASCTGLGILMQNLFVRTQYFDFRILMMRLRFTSTCRIHNANAGSLDKRHCTAYSSICIEYEFFISLRVTHVFLPSLQWKRTSTLFVLSLQRFVPVRVVIYVSCSFTSIRSYLWWKISWNRTFQFPYPLT